MLTLMLGKLHFMFSCLHSFLSLSLYCFRLLPNGTCYLNSTSFSLVEDNSFVYELKVMATVDLNLNSKFFHNSLHQN